MTTVSDMINELEDIAPPELADADDRIGLQVGDPSMEVRRVCVTVDVSVGVVDLAVEHRANLLVAHHPLIYAPLTSVAEIDPITQRLAKLIRANVALFVLHTNYDTVPGGVNDALASKLGVLNCRPLTTRKTDPLVKIAVFVPDSAVEQVRSAMAEAGAGVIGQYTHCSFRTQGIGSFVPLPAAQPYIGSAGKLEEVEECRLEMVCVGSRVNDVVAAMIEVHPYDEVAYDVYQLANEPIRYGYGRVGTLEDTISLREFVERVKRTLGLDYTKVSGNLDKPVKRVAFCAGGASLHYREAAQARADVYVTGDTKHQDMLDSNALGLAMIDAGHFETEKPGMVELTERLTKMFSGIEIEYIE